MRRPKSRGTGRRLFDRLQEIPPATAEQDIREAVAKRGISSNRIIEAMRVLGLCTGREDGLVRAFLHGDECSLGVAFAVLWLIREADSPDQPREHQ